MANKYNIKEWLDGFEKDKNEFNYDTDVLLSKSKILFPGRFYILNYKANTDKPYNAVPIIISMGISKKDPDSYICIDLCMIPRTARIKFVQYIFDLFEKQISENMEKFWNVEDADKQKQIIQFSYEVIEKLPVLKPLKHAVKKYKIENVYRIYSVPFSGVYKIIGKLPDKNRMVNGNVKDEQMKFLKKNQ